MMTSPDLVEFAYTNQYDLVWNDVGSGAIFDGAIYKPKLDGYLNLGFSTFGPAGYDPVGGVASRVALVARALQPGVIVPPDDYEWIGDDHHSGARLDCSWWRPIPPPGFVALGTAFVSYHGKPPPDAIACIPADLAGPAKGGRMVYADRGSGATHDIEIFEVYADAPGCVQVGATIVSPAYILGSPPELSGIPVLALKPPADPDGADALTAEEVHAIIAGSGPLLRLHPDETYLPMSPEGFLAKAIRTGDYLTAEQSVLGGDLATAEAYVFANQVCAQFTDLQFFFFYGYNGPPSIQVQLWLAKGGFFLGARTQDFDGLNCGQHQGDWEHVTLRVDNYLKTVVAVGYDSHGDTEWHAPPADGQVQCYASLNMHACAPVPGEYLELATWQSRDISGVSAEVKAYSRNLYADGGKTLDASTRYRIVASNFLPGIETPVWLGPDFEGVRWGPPVAHEDSITITEIPPLGSSYTYQLQQDDQGPVTASFSVD
jgi:hypothetical protein